MVCFAAHEEKVTRICSSMNSSGELETRGLKRRRWMYVISESPHAVAAVHVQERANVPSETRRGFFLSVGATKGKRMFDYAILTVKYFFDAINATYSDHLFFREIDTKGEIRDHPTALREAHEAGKRLARDPRKEKG